VGDRAGVVEEGLTAGGVELHLTALANHDDPEVDALLDQEAIALLEYVEREDAAWKEDCMEREQWQETGHGEA